MKTIFDQGSFRAYSHVDESRKPILEHSQFATRKTTVSISHKHDDLEDLKGILGFLEQTTWCKSLYWQSWSHYVEKNIRTNSPYH